jgi:hypothetical protein
MKLRLEYKNLQELADNPKNWRKHPDEQTKPLKEVIDKVGFAGAVLFNETTQHLIDSRYFRWFWLDTYRSTNTK